MDGVTVAVTMNDSQPDPCFAIQLITGGLHGRPTGNISYTYAGADETAGGSNVTVMFADNFTSGVRDPWLEDVKYYMSGVVNPLLCVCGLIGNVLNIVVLTRRHMQNALDCPMEKSAHLGLITLAASDMLYCLTALPDAFLSQSQTVFHGRSFWLYVQVYGPCLQNIFMNTSTWLTVVMAAGRYAAICRPLHARYLVQINGTRVAILLVFLAWILLEMPMLWTYNIVALRCPPDPTAFYLLDQGFFVRHGHFKMVFTYVWAAAGYFLPVVILVYCNAHLIAALRESYRMRKLYRVHSKAADPGAHITPTLVAIVCAFLVLVSPSEIIHFYYYAIQPDQVEVFNTAIVVTNMLQTINFSLNFLLYCVVNAHFRDTWKGLMYCLVRKEYRRVPKNGAATTATNVTNLTNGGSKSFALMSSCELVDQIQLNKTNVGGTVAESQKMIESVICR